MPVVLALDAGTGGAKAALFGLDGRLRALHAERWEYTVRTNPDVPFVKEYSFDPDRFWAALCRCAREALGQSGLDPNEVLGVSTTSQREGCVFLDERGTELYAGPNLDSRGFLEGLEVLASFGPERLYEITGHSAPFIFPISRYLWFRKHDSRPVAHLLMINDWMAFRLTGQPCTEPSNATESMLFDFRRRQWSEEILSQLDIPAHVLPPILRSGERAGAVSRAAAAATGLLAGTPVYTGGADTQCALLGAGALDPGDTAVILGTTAPVQTVVGEARLDPNANLWAGCHVVPERWVLESNAGSTGDAYHWMLDLLLPGEDSVARHAEAERRARAADDAGTFTYLGPRIFDLTKLRPDMPGGILFRFPSMQLRPDSGALLRAFLSSIGFAVRANLQQLAEVTEQHATELIAGGGMSRNGLLLQILADVTGLPVRHALEAESTGLGCAILVACGAGAYANVAAAARAMCRHETIPPDRQRGELLDTAFAKWRELYDGLDTLSI